MRTEQTNMKVIVRVRPFNSRELEQNKRSIIKVLDTKTLLFDPDEDDDEFFFQGTKQNFRDITKRVHKKLSMEFDRVFDTNITNTDIFEECTAPLVEAVLNGYNCSVFVYGATGAGKTFTMLGNDGCPGLTYLTMRELFQKIEDQSEEKKFNVAVSYLEVYNELILNLLAKSGPLKLLEDNNGVVVSGLMPKAIYSAEELLELLAKGNANRTQHPTDANAESSRSHAIFQVHIRITDRKTDAKRTVKLSMIDLAGSERAASTKGNGTRFREGASINKSLLALGNCINNLADGLKHIPYRGSKLTRILKDSLGGNCQTLMVANVSMSSLTYEDTYNTLKYASRAKKIRATVRQNTLKSNMPKDFYIRKLDELMTESKRDKDTIKSLEAKLSTTNAATTRSYDDNEVKNWYRKMDAVYSNVIKVQEYVIGIQSRIKVMGCTMKFKETYQKHCQQLKLNKPFTQEETDHFAASLARYTKHIEEQKAEYLRWRDKLTDAYKDLEKLKKEIKSAKCADILQLYQKCKDFELKNCKEKIQINHITNLNTEFAEEAKKLRKLLAVSCEALQLYYNDYGISMDLKANIDELQQLMRAHIALPLEMPNTTATMSNSDTSDDYGENVEKNEQRQVLHQQAQQQQKLPQITISNNGKRQLSNSSNDFEREFEYKSTAKRQRPMPIYLDIDTDLVNLGVGGASYLDDYGDTTAATTDGTDDSSIFKLPNANVAGAAAAIDLNATVVIPSAQSIANKAFDQSSVKLNAKANAPTSNALQKKNAYVNSILSNNLVKLPTNKDQMKNVLLKSQNFNHRGIVKSVTVGIQKENMKYSPNRIRKSPRALAAKALAGATHLVKKALPTATPSKNAHAKSDTAARAMQQPMPPVVRINRAASFRTKK